MKKGLCEFVFIIDRSGSMAGLEADTIGGFNAMIAKQKKLEGEAYVSVVLFDNDTRVLYDRTPIEKVREMTEEDYTVGGCTALYDAIGGAIHHIGNVHKYAREEDRPERTLFFITTDGMENASRNYRRDRVREMIERQEKRYGWEFVFVAANIDATEVAEDIGIEPQRTACYRATPRGTRAMYGAADRIVSACRHVRDFDDEEISNILKDLEEDEDADA